jgi:uncharacterized RDD family membrane protein YckC
LARIAHVVDSVTGVDVSLAVAGTGARALAFLIDLLIRSVLVISWYVVATLFYNGQWNLAAPLDPDSSWYLYVALPTTLIFALYHCVLEIAMRGRTPGKRMVGVRIVARNGAVPSAASHLVRNVFRLVDSFPLGYGVGLVTSVITKDHVRIGDLAAGTLLVYDNSQALDHRHFAPPVKGSKLSDDAAELVSELLDRWEMLEPAVRARLARSLLTRTTGASPDESTDEASLRRQLANLPQPNPAGSSP